MKQKRVGEVQSSTEATAISRANKKARKEQRRKERKANPSTEPQERQANAIVHSIGRRSSNERPPAAAWGNVAGAEWREQQEIAVIGVEGIPLLCSTVLSRASQRCFTLVSRCNLSDRAVSRSAVCAAPDVSHSIIVDASHCVCHLFSGAWLSAWVLLSLWLSPSLCCISPYCLPLCSLSLNVTHCAIFLTVLYFTVLYFTVFSLTLSLCRVSEDEIPAPCLTFAKTPFNDQIVRLLDSSFAQPTAVQAQAWPIALSGRDMITVSKTGSGVTACPGCVSLTVLTGSRCLSESVTGCVAVCVTDCAWVVSGVVGYFSD